MSYQVLARKWRPRCFEQMVGQTHVLRALINAFNQGRLHHAYLFTGTRGVGKTTLARIIAKCLNCESGVSATPCGECSACREIDEGRFVDLIEVDAASRTKVEDTRELLDNVQYAPTRGRYKVYLIDEVHMLSGHSFNALLKTLEEPPPHVKFLLATTDPQKLPITILSRCLQFNLKHLPQRAIAKYLQEILDQEGVPADEESLNALARSADGSMRDALSLLDQAIAFGDGQVREKEVNEMLGTVPREHLQILVSALAERDAQAVMRSVGKLAEHTADFAEVLSELLSLLHLSALYQQVPQAVDENVLNFSLASKLASTLSPEDVQLYYQIALTGRRDMPLAPDPRSGFEMVLLRMLSFQPVTSSKELLSSPKASPSPTKPRIEPSDIDQHGSESDSHQQERGRAAVRVDSTTSTDFDWSGIIDQLGLKGVAYALASNCSFKSYKGGEICLVLGEGHEEIRTKNAEQRLQRSLSHYFAQDNLRLRIVVAEHETETPAQTINRYSKERQGVAEQAIYDDPVVQGLQENFGAKVVPGTIKPADHA